MATTWTEITTQKVKEPEAMATNVKSDRDFELATIWSIVACRVCVYCGGRYSHDRTLMDDILNFVFQLRSLLIVGDEKVNAVEVLSTKLIR